MREDDIKKEMARIKESEHYKKYQEENEPKRAAAKVLNRKEPHLLGHTLDGKHKVWAPIAGPTAAMVEHLKIRKVWVCSWCKTTMHFKGSMLYQLAKRDELGNIVEPATFGPKAIVDFDGKAYHRGCYYEMDRQRQESLPDGKTGAPELPEKGKSDG